MHFFLALLLLLGVAGAGEADNICLCPLTGVCNCGPGCDCFELVVAQNCPGGVCPAPARRVASPTAAVSRPAVAQPPVLRQSIVERPRALPRLRLFRR